MGTFRFEELDDLTRGLMLREWEAEELGNPFRSADFTEAGVSAFPSLMRSAITTGDEDTLTSALSDPTFWRAYRPSHSKTGALIQVRVNARDAARRLAITEFNTAYVHGLCRRALEEGVPEVEVYRAAAASAPRGECLTHEGKRYPVELIYAGHRARYHAPVLRLDALQIPIGAYCHHTIRTVRS